MGEAFGVPFSGQNIAIVLVHVWHYRNVNGNQIFVYMYFASHSNMQVFKSCDISLWKIQAILSKLNIPKILLGMTVKIWLMRDDTKYSFWVWNTINSPS